MTNQNHFPILTDYNRTDCVLFHEFMLLRLMLGQINLGHELAQWKIDLNRSVCMHQHACIYIGVSCILIVCCIAYTFVEINNPYDITFEAFDINDKGFISIARIPSDAGQTQNTV